MYELSILIQGFPGKSSTHGLLGWSTVALLSGGNEHILIDCGNFGMRSLIIKKLLDKGLSPKDISKLLITHSHWDHIANWDLFPNAEIFLGKNELEWALSKPLGDTDVNYFYIKELSLFSNLYLIEHREEILPGITAHLVPGHSPGHIAYTVANDEKDLIFAGDAGKNRAEFLTHTVSMTLDEKASKKSLEYLWKLWEHKPLNLMIPGHDISMVLKNCQPIYTMGRECAIEAWFGRDLGEMTMLTID